MRVGKVPTTQHAHRPDQGGREGRPESSLTSHRSTGRRPGHRLDYPNCLFQLLTKMLIAFGALDEPLLIDAHEQPLSVRLLRHALRRYASDR